MASAMPGLSGEMQLERQVAAAGAAGSDGVVALPATEQGSSAAGQLAIQAAASSGYEPVSAVGSPAESEPAQLNAQRPPMP